MCLESGGIVLLVVAVILKLLHRVLVVVVGNFFDSPIIAITCDLKIEVWLVVDLELCIWAFFLRLGGELLFGSRATRTYLLLLVYLINILFATWLALNHDILCANHCLYIIFVGSAERFGSSLLAIHNV